VSIRLYVEGGGDAKALRIACREGFRLFIDKAGLTGRMPRIIACGTRQNAFESFETAQAQAASDTRPMMLIDSEGPATAANPWQHLQACNGWSRPDGATDSQCHLMVECMEAWFLADRPALAGYFGQHFQESALPANPKVEAVPKLDLLKGLEQATRQTSKGAYAKGKHSFPILGALDPAKVEAVAPSARRFLHTLRALSGGGE
jgi:hypothetical protein